MGSRDITAAEAVEYAKDPRNEGILVVVAQNYDPNGEEGEWDGITSGDVDTWTEPDGRVDVAAFGAWGPFQLWFEGEEDPGPPRSHTPEEALEAIERRLVVYQDGDMDGSISRALDTIEAFIKQVREHGSEDLEWGEPGSCIERVNNDDTIREELGFSPEAFGYAPLSRVIDLAVAKGLGRHYGDPHCIWCLQGQ